MPIKLFILLAGAAFTTTALAQAEPDVPYDGNWSATITTTEGKRQVSRVVLSKFAGTWYGPTSSAKSGCKNKPAPITVQQSNASGLIFTVWGKTVGPACQDLTVELKPVTEKALEGTVESVGSIKLVRR